ncbi:MAG TPA: MmcQ/YjbR family DNA-binding protein [Bauldia sp.]
MTAAEFRQIVLSMPDAVRGSHMDHPDFRVGNKVFATLGYSDANWGILKLTTEQQNMIVTAEPRRFKLANGAWGRRGSTLVLLEALDHTAATNAVRMAWENIAST